MSIIDKVRNTIIRYRMLDPGDRVMVALSGGADSVCLLSLLLTLKDEFAVTLCAAHLNHMLRGEEAEREAGFALALAEGWGVPCVSDERDVKAYTRSAKKLSTQQAARELRYRFLRESAAELGARKIALGHNANDQAETIIMNLLRGAGLEGMSGIPPVRDEIYVRPIIEVKRGEIEEYLKERGIVYVDDPSNFRPDYLRNRIRSQLIPLLERDYNPRLVERTSAMGDILREEGYAAVERSAELLSRALLDYSSDRAEIDIPALMAAPLGYRRRMIRGLLKRMGATIEAMDSAKIAAVLSLLMPGKSGKSYRLSSDLMAIVQFDRLVICKGSREAGEGLRVELTLPGTTTLPGGRGRLVVEIDDLKPFRLSSGKGRLASIDYRKISGPVVARHRSPGDRFSPLGMSGSKKLKDFFIEQRIPSRKRDGVLLLADDKGIIWVVGGRVSERVKITPETERVLRFRLEKSTEKNIID